MDRLWDEHGELNAARTQWLSRDELKELLRRGPVRFVVAAVGRPLQWIPVDECIAFWKADASMRLVDNPNSSFVLESSPNGMKYMASAWGPITGPTLIVLEVHH